MIKLDDLSMTDLLPASINSDREVKALALALDRQLRQVLEEIASVILMPRIDELPEETVDLLAWQLHVDFYEPLGMNLAKKRTLVKNSLQWHKRKGTKSVLEDMIGLLYTEEFILQEWFEYEGLPYYFRIIIGENAALTENDFKYTSRAVKELKNVRSWLVDILITKSYRATVYAGGAAGVYSKYLVKCTEGTGASVFPAFAMMIGGKTRLIQHLLVKETEGE